MDVWDRLSVELGLGPEFVEAARSVFLEHSETLRRLAVSEGDRVVFDLQRAMDRNSEPPNAAENTTSDY